MAIALQRPCRSRAEGRTSSVGIIERAARNVQRATIVDGYSDREAAMFVWDVDPVIFNVGPLAIRWYSLSWIAAFVIGYQI